MVRVPRCLLGLALLAGLAPLAGAALPAPERAYTVDEVQAGLTQRPAAWVGRAILVRGEATSQGALLSCWRATSPAPRGVRAICPALGTVTLSLAPTASWVVRIGSQAFRLSAPPLIVAQQASAAPAVPDRLSALVVPLARLPLLGPLVAAVVPSQSALYRIRLLGSGRCDLPPAPCPQALRP